jgi:hypothetical protein
MCSSSLNLDEEKMLTDQLWGQYRAKPCMVFGLYQNSRFGFSWSERQIFYSLHVIIIFHPSNQYNFHIWFALSNTLLAPAMPRFPINFLEISPKFHQFHEFWNRKFFATVVYKVNGVPNLEINCLCDNFCTFDLSMIQHVWIYCSGPNKTQLIYSLCRTESVYRQALYSNDC